MRPAGLVWPLLGLLYAAGAGWLLYNYSGEAANLLRGSWLHDLRIAAVPVYVALGLWLAERIWKWIEMLKGKGGRH
jgi:hypothetical protein